VSNVSDSTSASPYYPVFLDLKGRECLVVGGGEVALRKAEALSAAGANVTRVTPECSISPAGIHVMRRAFQDSDLDGMFLVIAATNDRSVNAGIAQKAKALHILVNAVDDPGACSFILPAVVKRGDVVLAVSTGGQSPILARRIKERLEQLFGPEYAPLAAMLGELRRNWLRDPRVAELSYGQRRDVWERILDLPLVQWICEGRMDHARSVVLNVLAETTPGQGT